MRRYVKLLLRPFITDISIINLKLIVEILVHKKGPLTRTTFDLQGKELSFLEQEHESVGTTYEISKLPLLEHHQFLQREVTSFWPQDAAERASVEVFHACHACRN